MYGLRDEGKWQRFCMPISILIAYYHFIIIAIIREQSNACAWLPINMSVDEEKWQVNIVIWHLTK